MFSNIARETSVTQGRIGEGSGTTLCITPLVADWRWYRGPLIRNTSEQSEIS